MADDIVDGAIAKLKKQLDQMDDDRAQAGRDPQVTEIIKNLEPILPTGAAERIRRDAGLSWVWVDIVRELTTENVRLRLLLFEHRIIP